MAEAPCHSVLDEISMYDPRKFKVGATVRICERPELDAFVKTWEYHHKLLPAQLAYAGQTATVKSAGMYHGGDVVYELQDIPGTWHERHLSCAP